MNPQAALLKASIDADVKEIESLYERLANYADALTTTEQAILAGYYLHNLYNAFENICLNVARSFENQISDRSQWHALLLKRMTLDVEGFRPKLLSTEAYRALDELRRFRHVFRIVNNCCSCSQSPAGNCYPWLRHKPHKPLRQSLQVPQSEAGKQGKRSGGLTSPQATPYPVYGRL
ncbi:MAG: hypothetical protein HC812_10190 [Leptolyngbya sp. RL_3_1]|nr:hypothetical protein [Leptolyngbya sp. RL_3_1]